MAVTTRPVETAPVPRSVGHQPVAATRSRRPRWVAPAVTGLVVGLGIAYTAWQDPNGSGAFPKCPTYSLFGIDCPGCGGLRATHAYTQGDILGAFDHNVLIAVLLPLGLLTWGVWMYRSIQDRPMTLPRLPLATLWVTIAVALAFTVVRNINGVGLFEYLAATA